MAMANVNLNYCKSMNWKHRRLILFSKKLIYFVISAFIAALCGFNLQLGKVQAHNPNLPQRVVRRIYPIGDIGYSGHNAVATELPTGDHQVLFEDAEDVDGIIKPPKVCYFDRNQLCSRRGLCQIDDRPCGANREYLDHEYKRAKVVAKPQMEGSRLDMLLKIARRPSYRASDLLVQKVKKDLTTADQSSKSVLEEIFGAQATNNMNKVAKQHQEAAVKTRNTILLPYMLLSRHERKLRRKRLFLMSTWIEDLLPDPHQGRDPFTNAAADAVKISIRAVQVLLSLCRLGSHPPRVTF